MQKLNDDDWEPQCGFLRTRQSIAFRMDAIGSRGMPYRIWTGMVWSESHIGS